MESVHPAAFFNSDVEMEMEANLLRSYHHMLSFSFMQSLLVAYIIMWVYGLHLDINALSHDAYTMKSKTILRWNLANLKY